MGLPKEDDRFEVVSLAAEAASHSGLGRRGPLGVIAPALPAVVTGTLHGFDIADRPLVTGLPGLPDEILPAESTVSLLSSHAGARVIILFDQGDVRRPIVVGVLRQTESRLVQPAPLLPPTAPPLQTLAALPSAKSGADVPVAPVSVSVDDQRLVLTAEREIVLQCGEASITLTRAGKVVIKGSYVASRSTGTNKIKGAAVEIN